MNDIFEPVEGTAVSSDGEDSDFNENGQTTNSEYGLFDTVDTIDSTRFVISPSCRNER